MSAVLTIRTARVAGPCANAAAAERGVEWAQHCLRIINKGDRYAEGEMDPYKAGGFGCERVCMSCAERGLV